MRFFTVTILLVLLSACAPARPIPYQLKEDIRLQIDRLYSPVKEKAFCLSSDGIHNVIEGGALGCQMPICRRSDVVVHTHPIFAEPFANIVDWSAWGRYKARFGNELYAVYGSNGLEVYER